MIFYNAHCYGTVKRGAGEEEATLEVMIKCQGKTAGTVDPQYRAMRAQCIMGDVMSGRQMVFYIKVLKWAVLSNRWKMKMCATRQLVWTHPTIKLRFPCVLCFGDEGLLTCLSLHSSLQQGAGHQLHLRGAAAVDVPQGVGSQVGHQQFRAPVQQVEHVLS